ncbi:MAG: hypothetical protein FWC72_03180 [Oscillospiraceae bacterium]|nr:hypothetical protein [Oscillospiraceae bacterium]
MGKKKTQCHICNNVMKTDKNEEAPSNCTLCSADFLNPGSETQLLRTVVQAEAGGVKANLVEILLTDKRLIFKEDGMSGAAGGGLIGGAIGGAIAGALSKKSEKFNAILRTEITSIEEKVAGLIKRKILVVHTVDGNAYPLALSKKEVEKWQAELSKCSA